MQATPLKRIGVLGVVQAKLKKIKPSSKNAVEKYREVLDQVLKDTKRLEEGLKAFLTGGTVSRIICQGGQQLECDRL